MPMSARLTFDGHSCCDYATSGVPRVGTSGSYASAYHRSMARQRLTLDSIGDAAEVGRWLAALEEVRRDSLKVLGEIPADAVDDDPGDGGDTVGTVLYHVALIEADWVFSDVLDRASAIPHDLFPVEHRLPDSRLSPLRGETMAQHLDRLARTRKLILDELRPMSADEFHESRAREQYDVSASWVVFHLIDHEVEHRVRLSALRDRFLGL
jgi:uncharacterized damage-inducible protein DinB